MSQGSERESIYEGKLISVERLSVDYPAYGGSIDGMYLLFGVLAAAHVLTVATPRFRVPWLPLAAVYASHALWVLPGLRARVGRGPTIAAGLFLLFFFAVCVPYFGVFGGRP